MEGYDSTSYGEAFADVYDDWYGDITDVHSRGGRARRARPAGRRLSRSSSSGWARVAWHYRSRKRCTPHR